MRANIGRLFACCSAPDDGPSSEEWPEVKIRGAPAAHGVLAGVLAVSKMKDMPMPLDTTCRTSSYDTVEELLVEQISDEQTAAGPASGVRGLSACEGASNGASDDEYEELVAEGTRAASQEDWRRAARAFRAAIALRPDEPVAHLKLGVALSNSSWHDVEAAQLFLLRRSPKEQFGASARRYESATSGCDGFLIDLDGTMYQPGGLLPGAREFYRWLVDSGTPYVFLSNTGSKNSASIQKKLSAAPYQLDTLVPLANILTAAEAQVDFMLTTVPAHARILVIQGGSGAWREDLRTRGGAAGAALVDTWQVRTALSDEEAKEWATYSACSRRVKRVWVAFFTVRL